MTKCFNIIDEMIHLLFHQKKSFVSSVSIISNTQFNITHSFLAHEHSQHIHNILFHRHIQSSNIHFLILLHIHTVCDETVWCEENEKKNERNKNEKMGSIRRRKECLNKLSIKERKNKEKTLDCIDLKEF